MPLRRHLRPGRPEIGLDEAGRGCLAGPVTAAAVLLRPGRRSPRDLNDSKQLTPERRDELRAWIEAHALAWGVGWATPAEVDAENVLQATMTAMHRALDALSRKLDRDPDRAPPHLLVDGHYFRTYPGHAHSCLVRGDERFQAIAAASVLAKTHRDERMRTLDAEHPGYGWAGNKGYPTRQHQRALTALGPSPAHRRSFRLSY